MERDPEFSGSRRPAKPSMDRRTMLLGATAFAGAASAVACRRDEREPFETPAVAPGKPPTQAAASASASAQAATAPPVRAPSSLRDHAVGFTLAHEQFTMPELVELGARAESAGFDLLGASDHLQTSQRNEGHAGHAWITLAAIGQRTSRIWLGTTVTCPTFRHNPAVVAEAFASLDALYPGRIFLGVGSGEALNEQAATGQWPKWSERSERLVEATNLIRNLWSGVAVKQKGPYYTVNAKLYDPPRRTIPLLMAGNGPKAMHRVGRYADGLITDPKTWKEHKAEFERGAAEAGKNVVDMPVLVELFSIVGDTNDAKAAAQMWRFLPKAWNPYFNVVDPGGIEQRANAEIPLEKVYGDWTVSTDPGVHAERLRELFASGATIVNVHSGQPDQARVIDFYGKEVLPRLRHA